MGTVWESYQKANQLALSHIGFSEHSPLPSGFNCPLYTGDLNLGFPLYAEDVALLKNGGYAPEPLLGMELDWLPSHLAWMRNLINAYPFDYVLGSIHYLDGYSVGALSSWPDSLSKERKFGRFDAYFHEMASLAASGLIQAVAHPDFIKLRAWPDFQLWLEDKHSKTAIAHALESMAAHNVALEINSAGLRQPFKEFYPGPSIMAMAADLGIKIIFGSDAHSAEHLAADFDKLAEYARSFGFERYLIFRQLEAFEMPV